MDFFTNFLSNISSYPNALPSHLNQGIIWGLMAIGVYITYKILDVADLTVDGSMVTGGAVCAMLVAMGVPIPIAMLCSILAGMVAGFVTGVLHTKAGIPAILAGILTQLMLYSVNQMIMGVPDFVKQLKAGADGAKISPTATLSYGGKLIISNSPLNTSVPETITKVLTTAAILIGICAALIGVLYWFFGTAYGASLRATGDNLEMSRAQGINTDSRKIVGLVLSNGIVALSGAAMSQYNTANDLNMGQGAIVTGLAAVIIGEVVFSRLTKNNFAMKLTGVLAGGVIYNAIQGIVIHFEILPTQYFKLFTAILVAVFLAVPYLRSRYSRSRGKKSVKEGGSGNA